ncbi:hypothetical protein CI105_02265 [Candidatus Izimaplasma bacterium ZiA1]|nr:hypothetical protein CI105_02265 [Candidatus Izimaplasma bacterium ZiA1]
MNKTYIVMLNSVFYFLLYLLWYALESQNGVVFFVSIILILSYLVISLFQVTKTRFTKVIDNEKIKWALFIYKAILFLLLFFISSIIPRGMLLIVIAFCFVFDNILTFFAYRNQGVFNKLINEFTLSMNDTKKGDAEQKKSSYQVLIISGKITSMMGVLISIDISREVLIPFQLLIAIILFLNTISQTYGLVYSLEEIEELCKKLRLFAKIRGNRRNVFLYNTALLTSIFIILGVDSIQSVGIKINFLPLLISSIIYASFIKVIKEIVRIEQNM